MNYEETVALLRTTQSHGLQRLHPQIHSIFSFIRETETRRDEATCTKLHSQSVARPTTLGSFNSCPYCWAVTVRAGSSTFQLCKPSPKLKCLPCLQTHTLKPGWVFSSLPGEATVSPSTWLSLEDNGCRLARLVRVGWRWGTDPASGECHYHSSSIPGVSSFFSATNTLIPQLNLNQSQRALNKSYV